MARKPTPRSVIQGRPALQWVMALLGAVVTLGVLGVVVREAAQPEQPPSLTARIVSVQAQDGGYVAEVEVVNRGLETAAGVDIEGRTAGDTATATLDYVPGQGRAAAHLRFSDDPTRAAVAVKGWSQP
jgi:uncharacterized protein (TIGR02588 family)